MANQEQGRGTLYVLGGTAIVVVAVLIGMLAWEPGRIGSGSNETPQDQAKPQAATQPPPVTAPSPSATPSTAQQTTTSQTGAASAGGKPAETSAEAAKAAEKAVPGAVLPSFDVVRVEPDGDSVIAGRAAPGATIELLRGDQVHARAVADASGLFALVPPPLPRGSHEIILQSIAPDGSRQRSRESVTVVINGDSRPLVALAAPDKPTVLLSNPEPPDAKATKEASSAPTTAPKSGSTEDGKAAAPAGVRVEIKIATVETEEGGRLFVSGQAAPGATVRLYLNDSFIAPGGAGGDGKFSFAIGKGMKSGDYRVRLDDVDPVSGNVKSRAEVAFSVPVEMAASEASPASPPVAGGPQTPGQSTVQTPNQATASAAATSSDPKALPPGTVVIPDVATAIVSKGDNLWRISRRIYGEGHRFTVIYNANQEQIRNPNLIYPGQVFVLPANQAQINP